MKRIILALLAALALALALSPLDAQTRHTQSYVDPENMTWYYTDENGDTLRLRGKPCREPSIVARINPNFLDDFRSGEAIVKGKRIPLCYDAVDRYAGRVHVIGENVEFFFPEELLTLEVRT